jgi:hypothetical protein
VVSRWVIGVLFCHEKAIGQNQANRNCFCLGRDYHMFAPGVFWGRSGGVRAPPGFLITKRPIVVMCSFSVRSIGRNFSQLEYADDRHCLRNLHGQAVERHPLNQPSPSVREFQAIGFAGLGAGVGFAIIIAVDFFVFPTHFGHSVEATLLGEFMGTQIGCRGTVIALAVVLAIPAGLVGLVVVGRISQPSRVEQSTEVSATVATQPVTKWYEGGTLHNADLNEWNAGTKENRLATCADFLFAVRGQMKPEFAKQLADPNSAESLAMASDFCVGIDKVMAEDAGANTPKTAAEAILILTGWVK